MPNELDTAKNIVKKLCSKDIELYARLLTEEAENKTETLQELLQELKEICEKALEELENKGE